jgi:hypothetical protein
MLSLSPFQSVITGDQETDRIQSNIANALNSMNTPLNASPFLGGQFIQNVSIGTGATVIPQSLGRTPVAWVICDQNTNTNVWRTAWSGTSLTLKAGSACVISIWVN